MLTKYDKFLAALITAVLAALSTLPTGEGWEWVPTAIAFLGALAVYVVPNRTTS